MRRILYLIGLSIVLAACNIVPDGTLPSPTGTSATPATLAAPSPTDAPTATIEPTAAPDGHAHLDTDEDTNGDVISRTDGHADAGAHPYYPIRPGRPSRARVEHGAGRPH